MIGKVFGRWEVVDKAEPYIRPKDSAVLPKWKCVCSCGKTKDVRESSLLSGDSTSCGCFARESASKRATTHGHSKHPLYQTWNDMLRRCNDPLRKDYKHYGGRGISVCNEWSDRINGFDNFLTEMFTEYKDDLELDRIDVNGNYCKENCRWTDRRTQVINRRSFNSPFDTHFVEFIGKTLCISQWADETGINKQIIADRLGKLKWPVEKALTFPVKVKQYFVLVKDRKIPIEDVFKNVPNLYYHAKKNNATFQEFLSGLFYNKFIIIGIVNKQEVEFKPTKDFSQLLDISKLKDSFKASAEYFFDSYGVKL